MLAELAHQGRMETAEVASLWGDGVAPARGLRREGTGTTRPPSRRAAQRVSRGTANLLDRALWLLVQRSDLWMRLDGESHDLLASQDAPYDAFFACLGRTPHD